MIYEILMQVLSHKKLGEINSGARPPGFIPIFLFISESLNFVSRLMLGILMLVSSVIVKLRFILFNFTDFSFSYLRTLMNLFCRYQK